MSCRKRRISSVSATDQQQSKKAKLLSHRWHKCEDADSIHDTRTSQESEFSIRAIIGEKPDQYLIDWADDRLTGESYSPDWQPKRNVSEAAIAAWENQKVVQRSKKKLSKQRRRPSNTISSIVIPDSQPTSTGSSSATNSAVPVERRGSAGNLRRSESRKPFPQSTGSFKHKTYREQLVSSTTGKSSHQRHRFDSQDMATTEDQVDKTFTAQDTSTSAVLSQRKVNWQSQVRPLNKEEPTSPSVRTKRASSASIRKSSDHVSLRIQQKVSEDSHTASAMDVPRRLSQTADPSKVPIGEKLKQIRAAGKAREAAYTLDTGVSDAGTPSTAILSSNEAAKNVHAAKASQPENHRSAPEPVAIKADGQGASTKLYASKSQEQAKVDGHLSAQQPVASQLSSIPQPQAYTTPEHQSRFLVRPMSVPVGVPLAVRSSPSAQRTLPGRAYAPRHQETMAIPKTTVLKPVGFDKNEHIIPLAMNTRVRDQYTSIINVYRDAIMKLMETEGQSPDCIARIGELLIRISNTLQHSDLDAEETLDQSSQPSPEDEATWAEQCSFKFGFLRHLLEEIRHQDIHVSIVAQPGRLLNIIETFLKGRGIVYFRPDGKGSSHPGDQRFAHCRCQVSVVPSGPEGRNLALNPAALIIAFDGSVSAVEPQVQRMRIQQQCSWLQPIVRLVIYKSAEHLAICLPAEIEQPDRIRRIVSGMTQLRHEVGVLQDEDMPVNAVAEEVAIALRLGGHERRWTLPSIRPLSLDFLDSSRSSSTQEGSQLSQEPEVSFQSSTLKRAWIDYLSKKNADLTSEIESLKHQINHLTTSHKALEAQLVTITRTNKNLLSQTSSTQSTHETHISDLEASLSSLQTRYEDKDRAHRHLHLEKTEVDESLASALQRIISQNTDLAALKASKKQLEVDLDLARKDLLTTPHQNPDITRITIAESSAREALTAKESLTKKVASLISELEFIRLEYQKASTSAVEFDAQVNTLTSQLEAANRKASGEAVRLATVNRDNAVKEAKREARQWKSMYEEREKVARREREEIETLKGRKGRGGVVTRGGSVQPGVGGVGVGQGKSPRGSRGGSPLGGVVGVGGEGMRRGGSGLRGEVV
ncbi:MAG: hypothetical protein Q9209_002142 [Squamulea sp. 1 TL-2023]